MAIFKQNFARKSVKSLAVALGTAALVLTTFMSSVSVAEAAEGVASVSPEAKKRYDDYMRNIVPVYFPAVPFGWDIRIKKDNSVVYTNEPPQQKREFEEDENAGPMGTQIVMRYTRKTRRMNAAQFADSYINTHGCSTKEEQGNGFYTTACVTSNTYTIIIGEVDNMYIIELSGDYNSAARAIVENYVGAITSGKRVFNDRSIGEIHRTVGQMQ